MVQNNLLYYIIFKKYPEKIISNRHNKELSKIAQKYADKLAALKTLKVHSFDFI
jgi:hypothetical protein